MSRQSPARKRESQHAYYMRNRERIKAWAAANRDRLREKARERARSAKYRENKAAYYAANRSVIRAKNDARYLERREVWNAQRRLARQENLADERRKDRERYVRERAQRLINAKVQKAKRKGASGAFTLPEWQALVALYQGRCRYCAKRAPLTADHRIPVSRGGSNDIANIVPACRSCNCAKQALTEAEFATRRLRELRAERALLLRQARALRESAPRYFGRAEQLAFAIR